ncbi:MAG: SDR family NAD(P)-dependent oxidoreductase [Actinocatenispora sp.]
MTATVLTGVSRGLGEALFDGLDRRGHRILALGRTFSAAQRRLANAEPDRVGLWAVDLAAAEPAVDSEAFAEFLGEDETEPAVLIHNAGSVEPVGAVGTLDARRVASTVRVNLIAPMLLTDAFLAAAGCNRPVRILFISSGAARRVIGGWATYCATKAGGEMFFDAVAEQYADEPRVVVANVSPGVIDTDMQAVLRDSDGVYFPEREHFVGLAERGELPSPATVAERILVEHLPMP